jgi:hypothetical protein
LGLSGRMVTDVIVGSELAFVLEGGSAAFCRSQDRGTTIEHSRRKKVMALISDHNPRGSALLNKRIEMFLFFINILGKKVDLFRNRSFLGIVLHALDINPGFGS